jgi:hypothetical protein
VMRRSRLTTSWLVIPPGLSITRSPFTSSLYGKSQGQCRTRSPYSLAKVGAIVSI